jgi:hypothetical protein
MNCFEEHPGDRLCVRLDGLPDSNRLSIAHNGSLPRDRPRHLSFKNCS